MIDLGFEFQTLNLCIVKLDNATIRITEIQFTSKTIKGGNYLGDTKTAR